MEDFFGNYKRELINSIENISLDGLNTLKHEILKVYKSEKKIFIIGNGGSASTATHFACDLGKGSSIDGKKRFKVISLTDNVALISAIANDISYDYIFEYQLQNLLEEGDLVIGITASGNSPNIIKGFEFAKQNKAKTFGLIGFSGGKVKELSDSFIHVDSYNYGIVEDIHLMINHVITQYLKQVMLGISTI